MNENEQEEWCKVPGFPQYDVSSLGRARSWAWKGRPPKGVPKEELRAQEPSLMTVDYGKDERGKVLLRRPGESARSWHVDRLVCWAFHGPPPPHHIVDHIDGDPGNVRAENLRWVSASAAAAPAMSQAGDLLQTLIDEVRGLREDIRAAMRD
jgi:hypothetical protein